GWHAREGRSRRRHRVRGPPRAPRVHGSRDGAERAGARSARSVAHARRDLPLVIRVLIVDDQALVRSGFRVILDTEPGIEAVGEAADGAEAVRLAAERHPDVICMDVEMPVMDGIEASRHINEADGSTSILILTTFGHEEYLFDALAA